MKALVFKDNQCRLVGNYPEPLARHGEVKVRVIAAGVCSTDLEILKGYMGFSGVMGHEFVGRVVDGPHKWLGKRVVSEICCVCGKCDMCSGGLKNHCRNRSVIGIDGRDGCFAEYIVVPELNIHEVPDSIDDNAAVFIEPLAAAYQLTRQIRFDISQKVLVIGDGRLGLLCAMVLKNICPDLTLIGKHAEKLAIAEKARIRTAMADKFPCRADADIVVEASGCPAGLDMAAKAVRPRGTVALKSTFAADGGINLAPFVINEITLIGSRCGPFPQAIAALESQEVDPSAMISQVVPLDMAEAAIAQAAGKMKVIINVS